MKWFKNLAVLTGILLGVVVSAVGCLLLVPPNRIVYFTGATVLVLALGIAAARILKSRNQPTGRGGKLQYAAVITGVMVLSATALIAAPWIARDAITNADIAWHRNLQADEDNTTIVGHRAYVRTDTQLQVLDTATGATRWRASLYDGSRGLATVVGQAGQVVMVDGRGVPARSYSPTGQLRWDRPPMPVSKKDFLLAVASDVTVTVDCGLDHPTCHLTGIGNDGSLRWRRQVHSGGDVSLELKHLGADVPFYSTTPKQIAVTETQSAAAEEHSTVISLIDPDTGKTQRTIPRASEAFLSHPTPTPAGVLLFTQLYSRHKCRLQLYQGARKVWSRTSTLVCGSRYGYNTRLRVIGNRAYGYDDVTPRYTVDLANGDVRKLAPGEGTVQGSKSCQNDLYRQPERLLGAEEILTPGPGIITATEAATGNRLWRHSLRHAFYRSCTASQVTDGNSVILEEDYDGYNPLLGPGVQDLGPDGDSGTRGLLRDEDPTRYTVLNRHTGATEARAVLPEDCEPFALAHSAWVSCYGGSSEGSASRTWLVGRG